MKVFLDTNVFLYAFLDQDAGKKRVAVEAIAGAVRAKNDSLPAAWRGA